MKTQLQNEVDIEFPDVPCAVNTLVQPDLIETRHAKNGRLLYRIKGIAMAWCNSLLEALRVAHIMIRAGKAPSLEQVV
jgi:hypothetical protein